MEERGGVVVSQRIASSSVERTAMSSGTRMPASMQAARICCPRMSLTVYRAVGLGSEASHAPRRGASMAKSAISPGVGSG